MQKPIIVVPRIPAELFLGDRYRVVHSSEEHAAFIAEGWSPEREPERSYVVHTAVEQAPELEAPIDPPADSDHAEGIDPALFSQTVIVQEDELPQMEPNLALAEPPATAKRKPAKRPYPVKLLAPEPTSAE